MFRDEARVRVSAGAGGPGCLSFRRERFLPKGGPDGGDGGRGGSVYLVADPETSTLLDLARRPHLRAEVGRPGQGNDRQGRQGRDLRVPVPVGTLVRDEASGLLIKDLSDPGQEVCVARGGRGGRGNAAFKSAVNQAPRQCEEGRPGEERVLLLELKLIADVGLLGLPNAGKSTLISRLSAAHPRIADYPFTTLEPHPGIVELDGYRRFLMMDIPGLLPGAHEGHGLGLRFLRHVERTRVLVHLVDLAPGPDEPPPEEAFRAIQAEIAAFGRGLPGKPRLVVYGKADLVPDPGARAEALNRTLGVEGLPVSSVSGLNLPRLVEACWALLHP